MQILAQHAGNVVTHQYLLKEVWGSPHVHDTHYLRIFVRKLRQKIEADPTQPRILLTELGVGYRLVVPRAGPERGRRIERLRRRQSPDVLFRVARVQRFAHHFEDTAMVGKIARSGLHSAALRQAILPTLRTLQLRLQRLAPRRVVEVRIVVGERLRRLDMQGREHRAVLLDHVGGLLLEIAELGELVHVCA